MKQISFTIISVLVAMVAAFFSFTINAKTTKGNGPQVIMTGEIAKKVIGYNGTTPVSISINNGRITSITALDNQETPAYFNKAKQKVFNQFIGKTVEEALKLGPEKLRDIAWKRYNAWYRSKEHANTEKPIPHTDEENDPAKETLIELETLEERATNGIREYLKNKNPYEYQDLVAALLRAMGYHTPFIAPKGKDGGIDIIAYLDPLGAQTPRIKVQVKHKPDTTIGAADVRALSGVLKAGDIALFVTSGTYSADARNAASSSDKFLRLIDGDEFIEMWQEYYPKMTDEDKNMLPLKQISFLGNNE